MQLFLTGFIAALLMFIAVLVLFPRLKKQKNLSADSSDQFSEKALRLIGELAHEIKNPLSTINVNLKLTAEQLSELERAYDGEQPLPNMLAFESAGRKIAIIEKETERLEHILNSFLRYADKNELHKLRTDINELVADMVDFYSPQCQSQSITVRSSFTSEPVFCKVDGDILKQAMLNFLINARQAMSGGGELMIKTDKQNDIAVIQISDTGDGIEPHRLGRIFDAYYSSRPGGSGLGLPTAKKIIEAHNGTITVDSELGKGTLFTIKLPLDKE